MKIAYLILCHKNPSQINLLTQALSSDGDDVYLHLDQKNDPTLWEEIAVNEQIFLLPYKESVPVFWGRFSICAGTLRLIQKALRKNYDYYVLLSGQDLPLCSPKDIKRKLSSIPGMNYINVIDQRDTHYPYFEKRNHLKYPSFLMGTSFFQKCSRNLYCYLTGGKAYTFPFFKKKSPFDQIYYGSQWWCIVGTCMKEMISLYENNPNIETFYKTSFIPDESLFSTLLMHTSYKEKHQPNLTYLTWDSRKTSPEIFTWKDQNILKEQAKNYLFARKFDLKCDPDIINEIVSSLKDES